MFGAQNSRVVTEPFKGAPHTVAHIKRAALGSQGDYQLRLLTEKIVGHLGSKDYLSEILAVYYWVLNNTRYCNDPRTVELVRSPSEILTRLKRAVQQLDKGWRPSLDCDDMVTLLVGMFLSLGREVRIVTVAFKLIQYRGQRQFQHVYIQVREPKTMNWIVLDPVAAEKSGDMLKRVKAAKIWAVA